MSKDIRRAYTVLSTIHLADGSVLEAGDNIHLADEQVVGLVNKVAPTDQAIDSTESSEVAKLKSDLADANRKLGEVKGYLKAAQDDIKALKGNTPTKVAEVAKVAEIAPTATKVADVAPKAVK